MFVRLTLICSLTIVVIAALWMTQLCMVREKDLALYKELMQKKEIAATKTPAFSSTNQYRKKVRKDIWFAQDDASRLHYRIESMGSVLTLIPVNNKFNVVESLEGIKCWMQDKLYYGNKDQIPMQQTRYIEAAEGIYQHATQEFVAQGVALSLFRLPGHLLPTQFLDAKKAFLKGIASNVSFSIAGKTPQFQAKQFTASINREND